VELFLAQPIGPLDLLLFTKLNRIVRLLATAGLRWTVLARRIGSTFDGTLVRVALLTLQKKLTTFATAELASGSGIACHD
jgi:hypothetical protein